MTLPIVALAIAAEIDAIDNELEHTVNEQTPEEFRQTASERIAKAALEASHHAELVEALKLSEQFLDKANALACDEYYGNRDVLAERLAEARDHSRALLAKLGEAA
jgi:hypothetical protein